VMDGRATCGDVACRPPFMFNDQGDANEAHRAEVLREKGAK
jgi:hypothetical protein